MLTDKTSMVTYLTVINTRVEMRKLLNENRQTIIDTQMIEQRKTRINSNLKKKSFAALDEPYDIDTPNKNMTEMMKPNATSISKHTKKQKKLRMSSSTIVLKKKCREMIENKTPRDHIEYIEIIKPIKTNERQVIRKHKLDDML